MPSASALQPLVGRKPTSTHLTMHMAAAKMGAAIRNAKEMAVAAW
jgi:hypothetical protein